MIRVLTTQDLDLLCNLDTLSFDQAWSKNQILEELTNPDARVLGYLEQTELRGAILARLVVDEVWIFRIMVLTEFRRHGLAQGLLSALFALVPAHTPAWLEVSVANEAALSFYKRAGFEEISRRPAYYPPKSPGAKPEDAIVMRRVAA